MAREWLTGGGGGVNYVQTSEPTYSEGDNWVDPSTGIYYAAYDSGNGGDWHPIPPVQVTDEATAFDGSDGETVSKDSELEIINGSIQLKSGSGTTATRPDDNNSAGGGDYTYDCGLAINPNKNLNKIDCIVSSNTNTSYDARLVDDNENVLETVSGNWTGGETITFQTSLNSGTRYHIHLKYDDGDNIVGTYDSASFPYTSEDIDITAGSFNASFTSLSTSDNTAYAFTDVIAYPPLPTSGDALIYWGNPTQINSWDLATFQRTLDNETVTIDVEDGSGSVLFSDISQNFDISTVSDSKEIRIRANFSRNDTNNIPTLDYCARRYTR